MKISQTSPPLSANSATVDAPGITVLVCGYNSAARLPATLAALAQLEAPIGYNVEVLIIDNASTDTTTVVVQQTLSALNLPFSTEVLYEGQAGKSHALEQGFACARYRYVCIVDDDNWLAPNYLNLAWEIMEANPQIGALGGVGEPVCEVIPPAWFAEFAIDYAAGPQAAQSGDITAAAGYLYGAGTIMRRAAWQQVHAVGFKSLLTGRKGNNLSSGEDNEMCFAIALAGYRIWFDDRLHFRHFIPTQRLTWDYVRRLYAGNAESSVNLLPYHHFMRCGTKCHIPTLPWLRNGIYAGLFTLRAGWQVVRLGRLGAVREGDRTALLVAFYWRSFQLYMQKEVTSDTKFEQVHTLRQRLMMAKESAA